MIGFLKGQVTHISGKEILILTASGVGYSVFAAGTLLASVKQGTELSAEIFTVVRETEITLYGFGAKDEKILFQKLLSVSGIGPKMAMEMVSVPPQHFLRAVEEGDIAFLTRIPGLGKKKAERLVVELRGKIDLSAVGGESAQVDPAKDEAIGALEGLGYDRATIKEILKKAPEGSGTEELVRYFLGSKA